MRNDARIERYKEMREIERQRFMETGNRDRLVDMAVLDQEIEKEMNKESRKLGWVLLGMTAVTLASPIIIWLFGSR